MWRQTSEALGCQMLPASLFMYQPFSRIITYWHVTRLPEAPEQQQVVPAILPAKDGAGGAGVIVNVEGRHGVARVISLRLARRVRP